VTFQFEPPINRLKSAEVQYVINNLNPKKSSGYDLITGKILKELPTVGIKLSYQDIQHRLARRVLPCIMKSCTDHPHFEARETS
jgi:hypothetical protein